MAFVFQVFSTADLVRVRLALRLDQGRANWRLERMVASLTPGGRSTQTPTGSRPSYKGVMTGWDLVHLRLALRGVARALEVAERGGNNVTGFTGFRTENGPSQGQNLALNGECVPSLLDS